MEINMEKRIITDLIKKCIVVYLFSSLVISIIMGVVYKHFEISIISYVFLSLIIPVGIKRIISILIILIIFFLFFVFDIYKYKKYKTLSIVSIILLVGKIPCLFYTRNIWVEMTDIFSLISKLLMK